MKITYIRRSDTSEYEHITTLQFEAVLDQHDPFVLAQPCWQRPRRIA